MKRANVFRSILALALIAVLCSSCGFAKRGGNAGENKTKGGGSGSASVSDSAVVTNLTARKLFEFREGKIEALYKNALVYKSDDEKKGICDFRGNDTGAKYDYVYEDYSIDGMFRVSESYAKYAVSNAVSSINIFGLLDSSGKTICACDYAYFNKLNDRYIEVYKAKAPVGTGVEGEYIYKWKNSPSTSKDTDSPAYSYEKSIIDLQTGLEVDETQIKYFGQYSYSDENCSFGDGSYVIRTTETDTVYGSNDKVLFTYNPNEYQVSKYNAGYYIAQKTVDGQKKYFLLDRSGKKISAEFDKIPEIYGDMLSVSRDSGYTLYSFDGEPVLDEVFDNIYFDELSKDLWGLKKGDSYIFVNGNGDVVLQASEKGKNKADVFASRGLVSTKTSDNKNAFYNFEEKDYSITAYSAYSVINLLVEVSDGDSRYDLIDVTNGNMLCEGYKDYTEGKCNDGCCYIAATRTEGGYDIYKVQNKVDAVKNSFEDDAVISEIQLNKIYKTKENMFTELEKALSDAGLSASIDKDNGEIAFDSAVVFAGDSSDISADGEKLLESFVKAYGSILNNEEYKGFISKTMVEGHTAPLATSTYESGLPLSQDRADEVKAFCKTIDAKLADQFEAVGYSNSMPIYNLDGTVNQDASRRVTFKCIINNEF